MKIIKFILLILGGLLLGLLLAEGLARLLLPKGDKYIALLRMRAPDLQMDAGTDLKNPNYNPFLQRRPISEWMCDGKNKERMNNEGFRDRDFTEAKSPGVKRIAVLGDSFTEGWMAPRGTAWPGVVEKELSPHVEVYNFGLANRSPLRYLALYDRVVRKYHPDWVIVCLYQNDLVEDENLRLYVSFDSNGIPERFDFKRYFRNTPRMPQTKGEKRLDRLEWFLCQHSRLYPYAAVYLCVDTDFRKRTLEAPKSADLDILWKTTSRYLETLNNLVRKDGAAFALAYAPDLGDFGNPNRLRVLAAPFAAFNRIPFFDANTFLANTNHPAALYIPNDGHLSVEGNKLYGKSIANWIQSLLLLQESPTSNDESSTFHPTR